MLEDENYVEHPKLLEHEKAQSNFNIMKSIY